MTCHCNHDPFATQRITVTIDVTDEPGNDALAVVALHDILGHLEHDGIVPTLIRLEITPTPTT